ncbi:MAG: hypothetical protein J7578_04165 [Chitinophagaceae bacterium]|nr:hypothetical protein [Chitinophagaceae bacterium]
MKFILLFLSIIILSLSTQAQQVKQEEIAQKVARKISDSLQLTKQQFTGIYNHTLDLQNRKIQAWQQFQNRDSLRIELQRIENGRDSLYKMVLNKFQFDTYLKKKHILISAI